MSVELKTFKRNGNEFVGDMDTPLNGDHHANGHHDEPEITLLSGAQNGRNGETMSSGRVFDEESCAWRVKRELCEVVYGKIRVWMVLVIVVVLAVIIVFASLALCAALYVDPDGKFEDRSSFKAARRFNGSFCLPDLTFTDELLNTSSNRSRDLASDLQGKLSNLYRSSPALGRYFSTAEISALRNGSVIAEYQLTFVLPREQEELLSNFTLSREMVYNVLRQYLYDQRHDDTLSSLYIDPVSLKLS
ncbi:TPA-induced transmembrane protein homolog isoform X2 [Corythoichthys intestinalis]|uniref:TPA-induced transmembrane protein homolog isoform X2 n=1 Tax=Corythoichthys intestinalis TaxID=161448 RepID=UPI0025A51E2E|nr:TPA-induced transmembrane protein homolog isoform X2 [Corythoichthys intestinalis]